MATVIWVVFAIISTAPGVLMLAILCALLRGVSHDVFADDDEDKYEGLHTGPTGVAPPPWLSRPPL